VRRVPVRRLTAGVQELDPETAHYLRRVLRLASGAAFVAFDPDARVEADAVLRDDGAAEIGALRPATVVADRPLVLVYALAKGDKVDATIRDATELGASKIVLAETARCVVKRTDRPKNERWRKIAEQAARQCGRADVPALEGVFGWEEALARAEGCRHRYCLHPAANEGVHLEARASYAFAVGPEGGLTDDEVLAAIKLGFRPASLGPFVLRTETVAAAVLGAVRVHDGPI